MDFCDPESNWHYDTNFYSLCRLKKGDLEQRTWIPREFAVKDKVIKIRNEATDTWENGWVVQDNGTSGTPGIVLDWMADQQRVVTGWKRRDAKVRLMTQRLEERWHPKKKVKSKVK